MCTGHHPGWQGLSQVLATRKSNEPLPKCLAARRNQAIDPERYCAATFADYRVLAYAIHALSKHPHLDPDAALTAQHRIPHPAESAQDD